jgi:hypothetical protein
VASLPHRSIPAAPTPTPDRRIAPRRDYNDTLRDIRALLMDELRDHPQNDHLVKQLTVGFDELTVEIKEQREQILALRLKAEHSISRGEVAKLAADAVLVTKERIDNLVKFVTVSHTAIGAVIAFMAAKVFHN